MQQACIQDGGLERMKVIYPSVHALPQTCAMGYDELARSSPARDEPASTRKAFGS